MPIPADQFCAALARRQFNFYSGVPCSFFKHAIDWMLHHPAMRYVAAVALTKVEAIRISRDEFLARMDDMDPVMRSIVKILVGRIRELSDQVAELKRMDWRPS